MLQRRWVRVGLILVGMVLVGGLCDRLWVATHEPILAWDQADYLTGAMNYWRALQSPQWFSRDWWVSLWLLSSKIPPLVYLLTVPFLNGLGTGFSASIWVNFLFHIVLVFSVYGIASFLFTSEVGLWSVAICSLLPGLYPLRLNFLLDYPVTAMTILVLWALTIWWFGGRNLRGKIWSRRGRSRVVRALLGAGEDGAQGRGSDVQVTEMNQVEALKSEALKSEAPKSEVQLLRELIQAPGMGAIESMTD
ncbi:MAG: hypothetical protein VKJ24_21715, partial [Synechococcales bacterium]|nr:hypothetical protein [Synechococcales bacterium]